VHQDDISTPDCFCECTEISQNRILSQTQQAQFKSFLAAYQNQNNLVEHAHELPDPLPNRVHHISADNYKDGFDNT
jgi:hypothetical protein